MRLIAPTSRKVLVVLVTAFAFLSTGLLAPAVTAGPGLGAVSTVAGLEEFARGFTKPLLVTHAGDGSGRVFVVEQAGIVRVLSSDGVRDPTPYVDLRAKIGSGGFEQGLLGLAFAPDFESSGRLYVSYTDKGGDSVLERYVVADPATGRPSASAGEVLLRVDQPYSNHNGGHIAFGPDGYLYVGLGDGGSGGDPLGNGQRLTTLLGKLLRLDVSPATGYAIPADNPFASGGGRAEIWAYGLRNPWRFSFDRESGDLVIGDVGQNLVEEIDFQAAGTPGGQNYGWNQWEGSYPYRVNANPVGKTFPVHEYLHSGLQCSVTGGHVYRGSDVPGLAGKYVFGDYCSGQIWMADPVGLKWIALQLLATNLLITSFGEDEAGELYVVNQGGAVYRFTPA